MQVGTRIVKKPEVGLYHPFFQKYIDQIDENVPLVKTYQDQIEDFLAFAKEELKPIEDHAYDIGKWTVKQVVGHIIDVERVMSYRLLCISRGDQTALPGFEEDAYIAASRYDQRSFEDILEELSIVRMATIKLLNPLAEEDYDKTGNSNGSSTSAGALAYMMAGHLNHHVQVLKERYLKS